MEEQFFFFFFEQYTPRQNGKRQQPDYEMLYERLKEGPLTFNEIEKLTCVAHSGVAQVITTLSLRYPIWSPKRGVYTLIDRD